MNNKIVFTVLLLVGLAVAHIDVSVMLPLDTVTSDGLNDPDALFRDLQKLRSVGTDGVKADVWWGLVERSPRVYTWTAYLQLAGQ